MIGEPTIKDAVEANRLLWQRCKQLLSQIEYRDYLLHTSISHVGVVLYGTYEEACALTGRMEMQTTRKWVLTPAMTDSEIVLTTFKMCLTSMEHRTREFFKYKGERIMSPHFDVEDLVALCKSGRADAGGRA